MKRKFNFDKGKNYEVKETIENANLPLTWAWNIFTCDRDYKKGEMIKLDKSYTIDKIEILENEDGKIIQLGYTKELVGNKPLTMRLPDKEFHPQKDMTDSIKAKSSYLKNKK
jgi:hypothetical protein